MYNTVGLEELVLETLQHSGNWMSYEEIAKILNYKWGVDRVLEKLTREQKIEEKYNMWRAIFEI